MTAALDGYKSKWGEEVKAAVDEWNAIVDDFYAQDDPRGLSQTRALGEINKFVAKNAVAVGSSGSLPGDMQRLWRSGDRDTYHMEYGFSNMGYETNGALGVKLAAPDREVYTFFGDGTDAAAGIDFSGEKGVAVTKYLVDLIKHENFVVDADGAGMAGLRDGSVSAYFSGTWDTANVKEALGENWAATVAPTYTLNDEAKQIAPFGGSKAIAVNPNSAQPKAASLLAAFLATPEAQLAHYELRNVIPCSVALQANETIKADAVAVAEASTIANTSVVQPLIPEMGNYWGPAETMGNAIYNGEVTLENAAAETEKFNNSLNNSGL
jgi:maltose-binding protein MalE